MVWIVCGAFSGGVLTGVFLMALLSVAKEKSDCSFQPKEANLFQSSPVDLTGYGVWHLTPRGWEPGAHRVSSGQHIADPPRDRVLTCSCGKEVLSTCGNTEKGVAEVWRCEDSLVVRDLMEKFGEYPPSV
jgi:hypothetical protein